MFAFDYLILSASDIAVYADDVEVDAANVVVAGVGDENGGTVTITPIPTAGVVIVLQRETELRRDTDYQTLGDFRAIVVNPDFDRLWLALQELLSGNQTIRNVLRVPSRESIPQLPAAADRANTLLGFDAGGNPIATVPATGTAADVLVQLANATDSTKGPALVGYGPGLAYPPGSIGFALQRGSGSVAASTSVGYGPSAGVSFAAGGTANTGVGYESQSATTTGIGNTAYGYRSLTANVNGNYSTAVGANNQYFATGLGFNSTFGYGCAYNITTGTSNVAMGFEALHDNRAGSANCAIGYSAQHYGLANGGVADPNNVTALGTYALQNNRASNSVAVGYSALKENQGSGNTAIGYNVAVSNTTGSQSTYLGESAGANKTVGTHDTMLGFQAGQSQTTSLGFNTYVGSLAGFYNTTALQNVFVGYAAGQGTSGLNGGGGNTAVGNQAMQLCGNVSGCVAMGSTALRSVTGSANTGLGSSAGINVTSGADNVLVGSSAGSGISTASQNVAVGKDTMGNLNGSGNTAVGYNAGSPAAAQTWVNTTSLGNGAQPTGSNQITLGNASVTAIRAQVTTITALSDARDKTDIAELAPLIPDAFLDLVLTPYVYNWAMRDGTKRDDGLQVGVIAQFLRDAQNQFNLAWLGLVDESNPERLEATPGKLLPLVCLRAQRQQAALVSLAERVRKLEGV